MPFNASVARLRAVNTIFARETPPGAVVLDAGAGRAPYRDLFEHTKYETADFEQLERDYATLTYTCDLVAIPVEDGRFDAIVCNQVLEHVPSPSDVLKEFFRVLKPGGRIILSAPLFYAEHEQPYDFYRYTQFGHRHLFDAAGLEIDSIERLEGYYGTLGYQLQTAAYTLPRRVKQGRIYYRIIAVGLALLFRPLFYLLASILQRLEMHIKIDKAYPKNYVVLARKPD